MGTLTGRRIVLGVTGGIAAYKAVEVCRRLVDAGAHVTPVLAEGALVHHAAVALQVELHMCAHVRICMQWYAYVHLYA